MNALQSKSAFLYRHVRRALRSGRYAPGQRIDPATIAEEFHTSATPVRFALYRLVGEGLIVDHARSGLYVPLLTEVALRDLYDWMQRLLLMACDIGVEELSALMRHWQECDIRSLSAGLSAYHERRKQMVPHIVACLGDNNDLLS